MITGHAKETVEEIIRVLNSRGLGNFLTGNVSFETSERTCPITGEPYLEMVSGHRVVPFVPALMALRSILSDVLAFSEKFLGPAMHEGNWRFSAVLYDNKNNSVSKVWHSINKEEADGQTDHLVSWLSLACSELTR